METKPLRVCYFGTYRQNYNRNQMMIAGLRMNGVEVIECHETLWRGIEDRVAATTGGWKRPAFWGRVLRAYTRLLRKFGQVGDFDILLVGYPGQFDVFVARLLAWLRRKPLVWDVFMSIYLIALERGLERRGQLAMALMRRAEALALRLPDRLIQDTASYVNWLCATHGVAAERFRLVPTGADDRVFKPFQAEESEPGVFRVIYYGTFIPNHGVEHIVEAARLLAEEGVLFELVGSGPEQARARQLAEAYALPHVTFCEWLDRPALMQRVARAQVVLGAFGTTPQSLMTVQNKIYEGLAMSKAVLSGDSEAVRQVLRHGEHIYLCERASGAALAEALRVLRADPALRARLARQGHRLFREQFCLQVNGQRFAAHLRELIET